VSNIKRTPKNSKYSNKYDNRDICQNIFSGIFNLENSFLKDGRKRVVTRQINLLSAQLVAVKIPLMEISARLVRTTTGTCLNI
jgi:hypothetical protein